MDNEKIKNAECMIISAVNTIKNSAYAGGCNEEMLRHRKFMYELRSIIKTYESEDKARIYDAEQQCMTLVDKSAETLIAQLSRLLEITRGV